MRHYIAGLSAFVLWGFSSLAVKPLQIYPASDILFFRVLFALLLVSVLNVVFRRKTVLRDINRLQSLSEASRRQALLLTFLGGLFLTANWYFFIFLVNSISVKAASFSYLVCPIVTMVLARIFLKEKLSSRQWFAVSLSALGCALLSIGYLKDAIFSLIVAFSYAAYLVSQRRNTGFDSLNMLMVHVSIAFCILAIVSVSHDFRLPREAFFYSHIAVLVVLLTIVPLSLNLFALKGVSSSGLGMLLYVNPIVNFLVAVIYFKESVSVLQLASNGVIVVAIVLFNLDQFTKNTGLSLFKRRESVPKTTRETPII